jgi:hypothetical protein
MIKMGGAHSKQGGNNKCIQMSQREGIIIYNFVAWFLMSRWEQRLSVLENIVLRRYGRIVGHGELHNEELHKLYSTSDVITVT